ncbi:MAG: DNA photolyase, partial [Pseudomonadota bacterium]
AWAAELKRVCAAHDATSVVTAYAPVGPVADKLRAARADLSDAGITLSSYRRPIDDLSWPHATRGFFGLKKKIPDILEDLERGLAPRLL